MIPKKPDIPIPENMRSLKFSDKGYLIPWFVKGDDFRIVDSEKAVLSYGKKVCWICGNEFCGGPYALVGSPESAMIRSFREPPCHIECAQYAVQVCPFLLYPSAKRRTAGLEGLDLIENSNEYLEIKTAADNVGENYVVIVNDFFFDRDSLLITCSEKEVVERQFWVKGQRQAKIPDPIVEFKDLSENIRLELIQTGQVKLSYNLELSSHTSDAHAVPVTQAVLSDKAWISPRDYSFIKDNILVSLNARELPKAILSFPVAFIRHDECFRLVGLMGIKPGSNKFVDSSCGWVLDYLPESYSIFPFSLQNQENFDNVFSVDERYITDVTTRSHSLGKLNPFFDDKGGPSESLTAIKKNLGAYLSAKNQTLAIANLLQEFSLLVPWSFRVNAPSQHSSSSPKEISNLFCVDEQKLNSLDFKALGKLRDTGALLVAYCQLLSMNKLSTLIND